MRKYFWENKSSETIFPGKETYCLSKLFNLNKYQLPIEYFGVKNQSKPEKEQKLSYAQWL